MEEWRIGRLESKKFTILQTSRPPAFHLSNLPTLYSPRRATQAIERRSAGFCFCRLHFRNFHCQQTCHARVDAIGLHVRLVYHSLGLGSEFLPATLWAKVAH